eukprot:TRINITY_DN71922_c0_g1_i1.p1 TRINITY_DN71922_c0_g1~~TRINITY_DN71922_c0_g1_i1.p1  ORF type:complete len:152 (+),score=25.26 TRINITY_DN71922_c0_g1_i1:33-488(+)
MPGVTVKDVDAQAFVAAYAKYLKRSGKIKLPKYVDYAKTGTHKELSPADPDWYYVRCASIARRIYVRGGLGVGWLARAYGHNKRDGVRRNHHQAAATGIIRHCIMSLEKMKVLEKSKNGGRQCTSTGRRDLDRIATRMAGATKVYKKRVKA